MILRLSKPCQNLHCLAKTWIYLIPYVCTERIFDIRNFMNFFFEKTLIEVGSSYLYPSFGTFCVQIGTLFEAQRVCKHSEEFRNRRHFAKMTVVCRFSNILQRLAVPRKIDQFGRKRCQKKRKDVDHKLL